MEIDAKKYPLISSDSHVFEPPTLWTDRIKGYDDVPRMSRVGDHDDWVLGGRTLCGTGVAANAGLRLEDPSQMKILGLFDDVPRAAYDPDERLHAQDVDGVAAEVLYATVGLMLYGQVRDSSFFSALCRAYNDWLAEFCATHPKRLLGMAMINTDDPASAVEELERARNMGLIGALIPVYPKWDLLYDRPEYENLWAAASDLEAPLALHVTTIRPGPLEGFSFEFPPLLTPRFLTSLDYWVKLSLADFILSGVFERHPKLHVGSVEHDLGWIPYFLYQLDYTYTDRMRRPHWPPKFKSDLLPSDYFRSNVFCSFQEDPQGIADRYIIGVDSLMWGSDYPHPESTYPKSVEITDRVLAGVPTPEREQILGGNCAKLFGLESLLVND